MWAITITRDNEPTPLDLLTCVLGTFAGQKTCIPPPLLPKALNQLLTVSSTGANRSSRMGKPHRTRWDMPHKPRRMNPSSSPAKNWMVPILSRSASRSKSGTSQMAIQRLQSFWVALSVNVLPTKNVRLGPFERRKSSPHVAQYGTHRRENTLRTLPWCDTVFHLVNPREITFEGAYNSVRKCGNRASAADHTNASATCVIVDFGNARDKVPPIGKVDIVDFVFDGGARNILTLSLERPNRIDYGAWAMLRECFLKPCFDIQLQ